MHLRPARGFTIVELLVVIAIIGLLATIVMTSLGTSRAKTRDAVRLQNLRTIGQALEEFRIDHGHYPISSTWASDCGGTSNNWIPDGNDYTWNDPYLPKVPRDPKQDCAVSPLQAYLYQSDGRQFQLTTELETPSPDQSGRSFDGFAFLPFNLQQEGALIATLSSSIHSPTNQSPIPFTVSFSHTVVDFSAGSLSVLSGFVNTVTAISEAVYSFFVNPTDNGTITVSLGSNVVHDSGGAGNIASQASVVYDPLRPHVALSPDPLPLSVSGAFTVSVNTTVAVTDFFASSVNVTNGTVSGVTQIAPLNGSNWQFTVTPTSPGAVSVVIEDGTLHSAAGNSNVRSNVIDTTYAP